MQSGVRLNIFLTWSLKIRLILKKQYAKWSEAQKELGKKLNRALKWSILGPQNLRLGGAEPLGPPRIRTWLGMNLAEKC